MLLEKSEMKKYNVQNFDWTLSQAEVVLGTISNPGYLVNGSAIAKMESPGAEAMEERACHSVLIYGWDKQ